MTPALEEAQRLLRLALRDSDTFDLLLPLAKAPIAAVGFHAQQAVEKSVEYRYDDEITSSMTREELNNTLTKVIGWAKIQFS